jgi:hypothetical protein
LKNVDYQSSNLELEELGLSPDKSRTARLIEGDSDTDFAVAVESGVDEDYNAPRPVAENPQVQLKKDRPGVAKGDPVPTQIRQGMPKKPLESHRSSEKISSGKNPAAAQKKTTVSKAASTESGISPAILNDSKLQ